MLKRSKKILLEGTLDEFKNYPRGAEGREYVLMNIEEKGPDGSYAFYEKDEKGDIIPVSYKGTEGYDATEFIQFTDPEFERIILANFNTNPKGGITAKEVDAITNIGELFRGNTALVTLEDLNILKKLELLHSRAFSNCTSLETVIIPSNIKTMEPLCFDQCSNLKNVKVYGDTQMIEASGTSASFGHVNLDCVEFYGTQTLRIGIRGDAKAEHAFISDNVITISDSTFTSFTTLTDVNIPHSVKSIGVSAFENCTSLTSIELPSSVEEIYGKAFAGCTGLNYIKCYREVPPTLQHTYIGNPFNGITSTCTLYVPINSLEAYQTANYWKDFENIVGFDPEG